MTNKIDGTYPLGNGWTVLQDLKEFFDNESDLINHLTDTYSINPDSFLNKGYKELGNNQAIYKHDFSWLIIGRIK